MAKSNDTKWRTTASEPYVSEAGWYFKTLAVQEIGEVNNLSKKKDLPTFYGITPGLVAFSAVVLRPQQNRNKSNQMFKIDLVQGWS